MDNLELIFKNYGFFLDFDEKFSICPLCKGNNTAYLLISRHFYCDNCTPEGTILEEVLRQLNIKVATIPTDVKELLEKNIDTLFNPDLKGITTGYTQLDNRTGGLLPDHLYILASETGMGKSVFSTNLLINISKNHHVSYYDLENGKLLMLKRFIAIAGLNPVSIFDDADNITDIIETSEKLSGKITFRDNEMLSPYISNQQGVKMAEAICELIRDDVRLKKSKVIIINHHLKKPDNGGGKRINNLAEVTTVSYRVPTIYDLTGTAKITNKATDVWVIVRQKDDPDINKRGRMLLRILKSREDRATDTNDLFFGMNLTNLKIVEMDFTRG